MSALLESMFDDFLDKALRGETVDLDGMLSAHDVSEAQRRPFDLVARALSNDLTLDASLGDCLADATRPRESLGDFHLIRTIGSGGMGVVYLAEQQSLGRLAAVKVLRPELARASSKVANEARAIAALNHPGIVRILDAGGDDEISWIAMELVPGRGLDEILADDDPPSPGMATRWIRDMALAVEAAHREGIVHRDVKPSNIRIRPDGRAVLLDFGLAKLAESADATRTGHFKGTPYYASPEQVRGDKLDALTDVYSLGVTLYETLCGVPPFKGETSHEVLDQILHRDPPRLRCHVRSLPRDLETVALHAMHKESHQRYSSARLFADDLTAVLEMQSIRARPDGLLRVLSRKTRRHPSIAIAIGIGLLSTIVLAILAIRDNASRELRAILAREDGLRAIQHDQFDSATRSFDAASAMDPDKVTTEDRHLLEVSIRKSRARGALAVARRSLTRFEDLLRERSRLEASESQRRPTLESAPRDAEETAQWQDDIAGLAEVEADLQSIRFDIEEKCTDARLNDPQRTDEASSLIAALYTALYRDAVMRDKASLIAHYRGLARDNDTLGTFAKELDANGTLTLNSSPSGAHVQLHRYEDLSKILPDTSSRSLPMCLTSNEEIFEPGTVVLRVVSHAGEITTGSLILEVERRSVADSIFVIDPGRASSIERGAFVTSWGSSRPRDIRDVTQLIASAAGNEDVGFEDSEGNSMVLTALEVESLGVRFGDARDLLLGGSVTAFVLEAGSLEELRLNAGVESRFTAAPLVVGPSNLVTPLHEYTLESGSWIATIAMKDREVVRLPFIIRFLQDTSLEIELYPLGTSPEGFVRVDVGDGSDTKTFVQEHEVTNREYAEFLTDNDVRAEIEASGHRSRVPRVGDSIYFGMDSNGHYRPSSNKLDFPVFGVSHKDAQAYAQWCTHRARSEGHVMEFSLIEDSVWTVAASGADGRLFPFGNTFRPWYTKCAFSREDREYERVLSFPIDESPYGIFDLAGSLAEWTRGKQGEALIRGSSWGASLPEAFQVSHRQLDEFGATYLSVGFRLQARIQ